MCGNILCGVAAAPAVGAGVGTNGVASPPVLEPAAAPVAPPAEAATPAAAPAQAATPAEAPPPTPATATPPTPAEAAPEAAPAAGEALLLTFMTLTM